jgi:folate-dependent phosphoribosylglycinamide formyltransferase PurN
MTDQTLVICGNDRIASLALAIGSGRTDVVLAVDESTRWARVIRLLRRGSLKAPLLLRMAYCEMRRRGVPVPDEYERVTRNADVLHLLSRHKPRRVLLFRAGLIINRAVISAGVPILNIHCSKLPEYGGIGTIARALEEGAVEQCATLHHVTEDIDGGEVLDIEPYQLDQSLGYCENEKRAYDAGLCLMRRTLGVK